MIHSIINRGVKDYHDAEARRQINLLNMASAISFTFTSFFLVSNILQHNWLPVISNCLLITFTVSMFLINQLKYYMASMYTLLVLMSLFFTVNAIFLHNNLQYGIFLLMVFTILLINNKTGRLILLSFEILLFLTFIVLQKKVPSLIADFPVYKTVIGSFAFLFIFACMLEYFKARLTQYHESLAIANTQLKESNRIKERMLSILSHDFYGPVGNLITSIDMLDEQLFTPEEFHNTSAKLKMQLQVLTSSMKDVVQWSKMQMQGETVAMDDIDIHSMIEEISLLMEMPLREKRLRLQNGLQPGTTAYANKDDVKLIFRNLFSNAIKFSNTSGSIFIDAEKNRGTIRISIKDEGTGMPLNILSALRAEQSNFFSTPGTAKEKGTGLGLMLVREFVQKNNGELSIASEPGKGSVFSVSLPSKWLPTTSKIPGEKTGTLKKGKFQAPLNQSPFAG